MTNMSYLAHYKPQEIICGSYKNNTSSFFLEQQLCRDYPLRVFVPRVACTSWKLKIWSEFHKYVFIQFSKVSSLTLRATCVKRFNTRKTSLMCHISFLKGFFHIFSEIKLLFLSLREPQEIYTHLVSFSNSVIKSMCLRSSIVFSEKCAAFLFSLSPLQELT